MRKAPHHRIAAGLCAAIATLVLPACDSTSPAPEPEVVAVESSSKNPVPAASTRATGPQQKSFFQARALDQAEAEIGAKAEDRVRVEPDAAVPAGTGTATANDDPRAGVPDPKVID